MSVEVTHPTHKPGGVDLAVLDKGDYVRLLATFHQATLFSTLETKIEFLSQWEVYPHLLFDHLGQTIFLTSWVKSSSFTIWVPRLLALQKRQASWR